MNPPDKRDFSFLSNVLQILSTNRKTGILEVRKESEKAQIVLKDGVIAYVTGSDPKERLGFFLTRKGYITKTQFQKSLAVAAEKRQFLGRVLVESGYLTEKALRQIVKKQAERILYNLFLWENCSFEFVEKDVNLDGSILVELPVMSVLLPASRYISEVFASRKIKGLGDHIFKVAVNTKEESSISLTQKETTVLRLVEKGLTVQQVIKESGFKEQAVCKILYSLKSSGIIK